MMKMFFVMIGPDILGLFIIVIATHLVWTDRLLEDWRRLCLKKQVLLIAIILILEIVSAYFQQETGASHLLLNKIVNMLGFALAPFVSFGLAFLCGEQKIEKKRIYYLPLWIWIILCFVSMWNGWIFKVTQEVHYQRGILFFLAPFFLLYGVFLLFCFIKKSVIEYTHEEKRFIALIFGIIAFGGIIQTQFRYSLFIWPCVAVAILVYYFFLRHQKIQFDQLTNVRDRKSFMERVQSLGPQIPVTIFMFDINQLKQVNDNYGHSEGDLYILEAVGIIKICLEKYGTIYRIGGDEFVVLCPEMDEADLKMALHRLKMENHKLFRHEQGEYPKNILSYGYSQYTGEEEDSLAKCLKRADADMYKMKKQLRK